MFLLIFPDMDKFSLDNQAAALSLRQKKPPSTLKVGEGGNFALI